MRGMRTLTVLGEVRRTPGVLGEVCRTLTVLGEVRRTSRVSGEARNTLGCGRGKEHTTVFEEVKRIPTVLLGQLPGRTWHYDNNYNKNKLITVKFKEIVYSANG